MFYVSGSKRGVSTQNQTPAIFFFSCLSSLKYVASKIGWFPSFFFLSFHSRHFSVLLFGMSGWSCSGVCKTHERDGGKDAGSGTNEATK